MESKSSILPPDMTMHDPNQSQSQTLLPVILDCFSTGILVLTTPQHIIYANATAQAICTQLRQNSTNPLPDELQRVYDALIDSRSLYPDRPIIIESTVTTPAGIFHVQGQWLSLDPVDQLCILLQLQDQNQSRQEVAIADVQQWHLTNREAEVWLRRRSGLSRKEIASELNITLDTVKKHLKSIYLKRQTILDEAAWHKDRAS